MNKWDLPMSRWRQPRLIWRRRSKQWSSLLAHFTKLKSKSWLRGIYLYFFIVSILLPQLPPEVHPSETWLSLDLDRALSWTKTCRKQPRSKTKRLPWWLWNQGKTLVSKCFVSRSRSGELSGRNGDGEPAEPRRHWLYCRWDRTSYLSSLLELKTLNFICALLLVSYDEYWETTIQ